MMMSMTMGLRLYQGLECRCCRQLIDPERQEADRVNALLYGTVAYGLCPRCHQEVPQDMRDGKYKNRAATFMRKQAREKAKREKSEQAKAVYTPTPSRSILELPMNAELTATFLTTCAIDALGNPVIEVWAQARRVTFETFAGLVLESGNLPHTEMRDAIMREIHHWYETKGQEP
jgi:hypothetical protein